MKAPKLWKWIPTSTFAIPHPLSTVLIGMGTELLLLEYRYLGQWFISNIISQAKLQRFKKKKFRCLWEENTQKCF